MGRICNQFSFVWIEFGKNESGTDQSVTRHGSSSSDIEIFYKNIKLIDNYDLTCDDEYIDVI
jgi:hypothetical protein